MIDYIIMRRKKILLGHHNSQVIVYIIGKVIITFWTLCSYIFINMRGNITFWTLCDDGLYDCERKCNFLYTLFCLYNYDHMERNTTSLTTCIAYIIG